MRPLTPDEQDKLERAYTFASKQRAFDDALTEVCERLQVPPIELPWRLLLMAGARLSHAHGDDGLPDVEAIVRGEAPLTPMQELKRYAAVQIAQACPCKSGEFVTMLGFALKAKLQELQALTNLAACMEPKRD